MLFLNKIYIGLLKFGDVDFSQFSKIAKTGLIIYPQRNQLYGILSAHS